MSSKFLDKTGLDTLWAKMKSTFQTLGNLVTAWGSTPSDTKYPSEKLVKDSLDGKANTALDNVTAKSLANLYSITDGRSSHQNIAAGYGLLATIDYSNHGAYSDTNAVFELYDKASNSVFTGRRYLIVNIRNNSSSSGASGTYVYKVTELIQAPVWERLSLKVYRTDNTNIRIYSLGAGTSYYGGMVCKLVSCTDYNGASKYTKITMHQGSATSTVPSGTEIPITIVTEDYSTYRTIPQDVSKGANLVVNGQGQMGTIYNWPGFTYNGADCVNGSAGSFYRTNNTTNSILLESTEYITVDCTKKSYYSADVKYTGQSANKNLYLVALMYDIDKLEIKAEYVMYGTGTLTTLAQDLNPGDQIIHLTSVDNWSTGISQTYQRGFIFWNYTNSKGYMYPPETYSRNLYTNWFDSAESINTTNNTITLNKAWTGPKIVAGTKVSKCNSGVTYVYVASRTITPAENGTWFTLKGSLRGFATTGTNPNNYRQGTAFIKPAFLVYCGTDIYFHFTNYKVYEVPDESDKLATSRKLAVSLSNTSTDTSFNGSTDVTNIKTTGTLGVSNGGTGKSSVTAGNYLVGNGTNALTEKTPSQVGSNVLVALDGGTDNVYDGDYIVCSNHTSGRTDTTKFVKRTVSKLWNYINGQISSVLGLTATSYGGNAATATTAAGYTSGGAIDTALGNKVDKETGKGLSTNDFTDAYKSSVDSNTSARHTHSNKTVLDGISSTDVSNWNAAEPNVQSNWNETSSSSDAYIANKPMCGNIVVPNAKWLKLSIPRGTQALHASFMMQTSHGATQMLGVLCMNNYISGDTETITGVSICMLRGGKNAGQNIDGVYEENDGNGYKNFYLYFGDDNAQHNVYWTWAGGTNNISISVADSTPSTVLPMGHSYLPVIAKNIVDRSISVGSDTQPVYISNNGRIEACKKLVQAVTSIDTSNMDPDVLYVM